MKNQNSKVRSQKQKAKGKSDNILLNIFDILGRLRDPGIHSGRGSKTFDF